MVRTKRLDVAGATALLTVVYSGSVLALILGFYSRIAEARAHAAFNAGVIVLVLTLYAFRNRNELLGTAFSFHPVLLYAFFYSQTGLLNRVLIPSSLDSSFLAADEALFGRFPGYFLHEFVSGRIADELMHLFYFSYYLSIPVVAVLLYRTNRTRFHCFLFHLSALFYFCYAIFILLPVEGPVWLRESFFTGPSFFRAIVDFLFEKAEHGGGAFPSSHVAIAVVVAWWAGRTFPRLRWPFVVQASMLSVATVYCSYHYSVDVGAGVAVGLAAIALWKWRGERAVGCLPAVGDE